MKMGASFAPGAILAKSRDGGARAVVFVGAFVPVNKSGPGWCYAPPIVASSRRARRVDCSTPSPSPPPLRSRSFFAMDILYSCCAGLDVHKQKVVVCVRKLTGGVVRQEVRTFRTETNALLDMADWLTEEG